MPYWDRRMVKSSGYEAAPRKRGLELADVEAGFSRRRRVARRLIVGRAPDGQGSAQGEGRKALWAERRMIKSSGYESAPRKRGLRVWWHGSRL